MSSQPWMALGHVAPEALVDARLALHYAAQPLASAAYARLPMQDDHAHTNLLWDAELQAFRGRPLPGGATLLLDPAGLALRAESPSGAELGSTALEGRTLEEAFRDVEGLLEVAGEAVPAGSLELPGYDLPGAPVARGGVFAAEPAAREELARWFHDAAGVLATVASELPGTPEVRGWPHHFDLAALVTLDAGTDPEAARSVGLGFSPGDGSYPEPYVYVSPWPYPAVEALPALSAGAHWHTEGFTAAVLPAEALVSAGGAEDQQRTVLEFLRGASSASLDLLRS